ncbi:type II toxin-antitoxin system VapC family toxin [Roseivirga sp.]|uniref:type II toxin-antitoxin system VapC family toxin n=1 Tax=Roseivirga sp. TaxID=1964215 RepID=UPI003B515F83
MKYLLDTHILLWFLSNDQSLKPQQRQAIESLDNQCLVSSASLWEITIKYTLQKLKLKIELVDFFDLISKSGFDILDIKPEHFVRLTQLPFLHRDPFDRLIIAQSIEENTVLITSDDQVLKYKIQSL